MDPQILGLIIGGLFGAFLVLGGLADPDKIVGTLRLKDFHAMRVIAVFVLTGLVGTWILEMAGAAHFSVKPAQMVSVLVGGALLGIGFGMTGYCPGTGLACAAAGRIDALVSILGMLLGALAFILLYPAVVAPLNGVLDYGKALLPDVTGIPRAVWAIGLGGGGAALLFLTRERKPRGS